MRDDIFISYKNGGEGSNFADRLKRDLNEKGYSVYYDSDRQVAGPFPEQLKNAIQICEDFILILSKECIKQLIANESVDWVREEIICAHKFGKNIIPVLIGDAIMPKEKEVFPEKLRFVADLTAVSLPVQYLFTPFEELIKKFNSKPINDRYRIVENSNEEYNVHEDFCATLQRALNNEPEAIYEIANMYYYGFASEKDGHACVNYLESSKWLKKLLNIFEKEETVPDFVISAETMLADMYYSGVVAYEEQSFEKTISTLESASSRKMTGNFDFNSAFEKKGFMLTDGVGTKFDYEKIMEYLEVYEKNCSNNAKNNISKFYMRYGLYDKAIEVMESINDSYPDIDYRLGTIYLQGLHCKPPKPDVYRAEHYFSMAAHNGHLDAMHAWGLLYFRGQYGYRQDMPRAREVFKEAAYRGHRGAQYDYAWMCKYGIGGDRDLKEAIDYFEKAAIQGHALCRAELAQLYQEPDCRNYQKAFEWAEKAALAGDRKGEFILGNLYFFGRGCKSDLDKAVIYYQKAFKHGLFQAKFMLDKVKSFTDNVKDCC